MSNQPAYIPLFGNDYLGDTMHLTTEEHGAYLLLMIAAWKQDDCGLPLDDKKLAAVVRLPARKWAAIKDTILEFWTVDNGRIYQRRLCKEFDYARKKSEANRKSASARWSKQGTENVEGGSCERISERNAPQPQPQIEEEPKGSPSAREDQIDPPVEPPQPAKRKRDLVAPHPLPDGWEPEFGPKRAALVNAWPEGMLENQINRFRLHAQRNQRVATNWNAAFGTWVDRAEQGRTGYGNSGQATQPVSSRSWPERDHRDGFQRALDRELGLDPADQPPGQTGRRDDGPPAGYPRLSGAAG